MKFRKLCLTSLAAALLAISFFGADLQAATKPNEKSKGAPAVTTAAPAVTSPHVPDLEFITRLRQEEYSYSQVMDIMSHLTDVIGARLTGSPNMKKANEWGTRGPVRPMGPREWAFGALGYLWAGLGLPALRGPHDLARLHAIYCPSRSLDAGDERPVARRSDARDSL